MSATSIFDRITIIGLGLIGSSIARAAREYGLSDIIIGCDSNEVALTYARSNRFIHSAITDPKTAVAESQLVVLAVPPAALGAIARQIGPALAKDTIVMDVASIKGPAIAAIAPHLPPHVHFIPAHPIAGSEQSGVTAGRADLFQRKLVIVTPVELQEGRALQCATAFWNGMGARLEGIPPELHDIIYAYVSHLPQLLAYAAGAILKGPAARDPDLKQFLRLASSDTALWTEIYAANKNNIISALENYLKVVSHIKNELAQAPKEEGNGFDKSLAASVLFPRVAASCLITSVMEAERNAGCVFARYAGSGFADFTSPAAVAPEGDIEHISSQHAAVADLLGEYINHLSSYHSMMTQDQWPALQKALKS